MPTSPEAIALQPAGVAQIFSLINVSLEAFADARREAATAHVRGVVTRG